MTITATAVEHRVHKIASAPGVQVVLVGCVSEVQRWETVDTRAGSMMVL